MRLSIHVKEIVCVFFSFFSFSFFSRICRLTDSTGLNADFVATFSAMGDNKCLGLARQQKQKPFVSSLCCYVTLSPVV